MKRPISNRRGFTLIEVIIVAAVISILSGIAIFSINQFYNSQIRKATIAECHQLATALSFAEQDVQFYPRFNYVNRSLNLITLGSTTGVVPRLDYYGFLSTDPRILPRIQGKWDGPYLGVSATRDRSSRGGRSGIIKMRLPDVTETFNGIDFSLVDWPADIYGQPYLLYTLKSEIVTGNVVPFFVERESDVGDFLNAVVSYGANGIPGGNEFTNAMFADTVLIPGAMWVTGDIVAGGIADFTLRTATAADPNLRLVNSTPLHVAFLQALSVQSVLPAQYSIPDGRVGTIDEGTDDIVFEF